MTLSARHLHVLERGPVTAAATIDLGASPYPELLLTGSGVSITSFGTKRYARKAIRCAGANTLVASTNLVLPGGRNIVTAAGDHFTAYSEATDVWRVDSYTPAGQSPGGGWITYSPTPTAETPGGTPPTFGTVTAAYFLIGKSMLWRARVSITAAGTGTGSVNIPLPSGFTGAELQHIGGTEAAATRKALNGLIVAAGSTVAVRYYDGSIAIATGALLALTGVIEVA